MNSRSCIRVVIIIPSVIHNIRIHRFYAGFRESLFHFFECRFNIVIVNGHHIIVPGIVLRTEIASCCNAVDIFIKVRLNDIHIRTSCSTRYGLPGHIFSVCGKLVIFLQFFECLAGKITHMCIFIAVDLCFCHRELTSKEHSLNINRLAKRNDISTHTANAFTHDRMCPHSIICIDIQRFQIDIINCCFFFVTYFDFQEFTHEMISVIHGNFHGNIPVYTVFGNGLKREFYHDSAVRIYFFNFAAFQSHLAGSDHGTCICCTDCFAVHLYFCRRCPCLTVRLW